MWAGDNQALALVCDQPFRMFMRRQRRRSGTFWFQTGSFASGKESIRCQLARVGDSVRIMSNSPLVPTTAVAAFGLMGGFLAGRRTGRRDLAGALFAATGAWCARGWYRASGPVAAAGLSALYVAGMGVSHPLAKRIGAWPSVAVVTAVTVTTAELVTRIGAGNTVAGR